MPLNNETQTDRDVKKLREESLSFRLLQLVSYLAQEMEIMLDTNMKTFGKNFRIRSDMVDAIHHQICALIKENEQLKQEIKSLNQIIIELKEEIYGLEEDLSIYEH